MQPDCDMMQQVLRYLGHVFSSVMEQQGACTYERYGVDLRVRARGRGREILRVPQLVKQFPPSCGTGWFISVFTTAATVYCPERA